MTGFRMRSLATSYCDQCKNSFRGNYDYYPLCGDCDDLKKVKATIVAASEPNELEKELLSDGKSKGKDAKEGQLGENRTESLDMRLNRMMHGDDLPLFLQEFVVDWEAGKRKKGKEEPKVNPVTELKEEEVKEELDKSNEVDSGKFVKNEPKEDLTSHNGPMGLPSLSWEAKPPHRKNAITSKPPIDVIGIMNSVKACPRETNAKSKEDRKQHTDTTEPKYKIPKVKMGEQRIKDLVAAYDAGASGMKTNKQTVEGTSRSRSSRRSERSRSRSRGKFCERDAKRSERSRRDRKRNIKYIG